MRKKGLIALFLVLFCLTPVIGGGLYFLKKDTYNLILNLAYGKNIREELTKLNKGKLFWLYLRYFHEGGKKIKAGYYEINGEYNILEIVDMLEEGRGQFQKITIIEGTPLKQIFTQLEQAGIGKKEKYEEVLKEKTFVYPTPNGNWEGYFYPETYKIPKNFQEKEVIDLFLEEFLKHFPKERYPNKKEFYQKLILASLLEREAQLKEEKPIMASVIENRLNKGMRLEIDSTVNYLFDYQKKRIYYKDLKIDSPYNTYRYAGLPPGPICSPTTDSVGAAYHPAKTDYYFFVVKGDGGHYFTKTYREHMEFQKTGRNN